MLPARFSYAGLLELRIQVESVVGQDLRNASWHKERFRRARQSVAHMLSLLSLKLGLPAASFKPWSLRAFRSLLC